MIKKKRTNYYGRGANVERKAVTEHADNGAILTGRFASSKCKGRIKADVVALYDDRLVIEQYKKGKTSFKKDMEAFNNTELPSVVRVERNFVCIQSR